MYDTLQCNQSEFMHNRENLLSAWKRGGELYTLLIKETDALFGNLDLRTMLASALCPHDPISSWLRVPVFCWRDHGDMCIILWTAPNFRRLGLAKYIIEQLSIKRVYNQLEESKAFWQRLSIPNVDKLSKDEASQPY